MIVRKGAWYSYKGDNISQGRENAIKYLEDNPEIAKVVEIQVRQKLETGAVVSANSVTVTAHEHNEEADEVELELD